VQSPYLYTFKETRNRFRGFDSTRVYVVWRAGTTNSVVVQARQAGNRFLGSVKGLQIQALIPFLCTVHYLQSRSQEENLPCWKVSELDDLQ
jgi:hypothetical protein